MATFAFALTSEQDSIRGAIYIAAPPDRVFRALTDPQQVPQWWGQQGMYRITKWQGELKPGGKWRSDGVGADGSSFHVEGEYLEVDPPRLLVHTWVASFAAFPTTVRFDLEPHDQGTLLKVHHSGFAGHPQEAKDHGEGWARVLAWMQAFLERGATVDSRG